MHTRGRRALHSRAATRPYRPVASRCSKSWPVWGDVLGVKHDVKASSGAKLRVKEGFPPTESVPMPNRRRSDGNGPDTSLHVQWDL